MAWSGGPQATGAQQDQQRSQALQPDLLKPLRERDDAGPPPGAFSTEHHCTNESQKNKGLQKAWLTWQ
jgi:hypothetical protein